MTVANVTVLLTARKLQLTIFCSLQRVVSGDILLSWAVSVFLFTAGQGLEFFFSTVTVITW